MQKRISMKKRTFCVFLIARLFLFSSHERHFIPFSYWRVGDNLQNTQKLKPNDKAGMGETYRNLGIVHQNSSHFHEAIEYHECYL